MKDQEFSRPREEVSPLREEFAAPAAEFSLPKQEYHMTGPEVQQTATPPAEKKKKGINPLMLTTAAVVTASVALSMAPTHIRQNSTHQLSAENQVYLEAIHSALNTMDSNAALELALNGQLQQFYIQELTPFKESLLTTENTGYGLYELHINDLNEDIGEAHCTSFEYLGNGVISIPIYDRASTTIYYLEYQTDVDRVTGESRLFPRSVAFNCYEQNDYKHRTEPFRHQSFYCHPKEDGTVDFWGFTDYTYQQLEGESIYYAPPTEGISMRYYDNWIGYGAVLEVIEGTFVEDTKYDPNVDAYEDTYLHNGTITLYQEVNGQWVENYVIEVKDGYTILQDGISLVKNPSTVDWYYLMAIMEDGREYHISSNHPSWSLEENILYHGIRIY